MLSFDFLVKGKTECNSEKRKKMKKAKGFSANILFIVLIFYNSASGKFKEYFFMPRVWASFTLRFFDF